LNADVFFSLSYIVGSFEAKDAPVQTVLKTIKTLSRNLGNYAHLVIPAILKLVENEPLPPLSIQVPCLHPFFTY